MVDNPKGFQRKEVLTWDDVDKLVDVLIPQLQSVGPFEAMILITRGGVIPGGMLAEILDIKHMLTAAVDFPSKSKGAQSSMVSWPSFLQFPDSSLLQGRRTLIVDDVWGSGRTSTAVRGRVQAAGAEPFTCVFTITRIDPCLARRSRTFMARLRTRILFTRGSWSAGCAG